MKHLAQMSDEEFSHWLNLMLPLVGSAQCRVFKYLREQAREYKEMLS